MTLHIVLQLANKTYVKCDHTKISLNNGWDSILYAITNDAPIRGVLLLLQSTTAQRQSYDILLGGFAVYDNLITESIRFEL